MAAKTKKSTTRKGTAKKPATKSTARKTTKKRSSKPKGIQHEVGRHRFPPGTKVEVHESHRVSVERNAGREPFPKPLSTATVKKDGSLEVRVPKKGHYAVAGEVDGRYLYVLTAAK